MIADKVNVVNNWDNSACVIQYDDGLEFDKHIMSIEIPIHLIPVLITKLDKFKMFHDKLKSLDK